MQSRSGIISEIATATKSSEHNKKCRDETQYSDHSYDYFALDNELTLLSAFAVDQMLSSTAILRLRHLIYHPHPENQYLRREVSSYTPFNGLVEVTVVELRYEQS